MRSSYLKPDLHEIIRRDRPRRADILVILLVALRPVHADANLPVARPPVFLRGSTGVTHLRYFFGTIAPHSPGLTSATDCENVQW